MTEVLPVPILPGIRQDADRTVLPIGALVAASGVRTRKGSIAKANGLVDAGTTTQTGSMSGPCDALGHAAGRQVSVMNGRTYAREGTGDTWMELGRASRARPVKAHWMAFQEVGLSVARVACASIGEFTAAAYEDGGGVQVVIMDPAGIRRAAATFTSRDMPRIFAVGTTFVLTMRDGGTPTVRYLTINSTTLAFSAQSEAGVLQTAGDSYDAAPFSSTEWLFARRSAATTFIVALRSLSAEVDVETVACANAVITACSVFGTDGEGIWCTFDDGTGQKLAAFTENLSATTGGPTSFAAAFSPARPAVMTRRTSSTIWVVWTEFVGGPNHYLMRVGAFDTTAALTGGNVGYAWHVHPASRPWGGDTTRMNIWVSTDGGVGSEAEAPSPWATNRRYALLTLVMDLDTPGAFGMFLEPELAPDERSSFDQDFHVPECSFRTTTDESGASVQRAFFPALAVIRTQAESTAAGTPALVLYEWETEAGFDARMRRVAEVGGQGVVFGGGLQEIPSSRINPSPIDTLARGVENGFLFAPAILRADKTATGADGLTVDTVYQFQAVFEYITPDGLRTRSAPSNIVAETPTAGLLNVELKISTSPTTEREFSAPPNATAVHIYATTGGGSTFQRITPDSGLSAGRGTTSVGLITYVHSAADATYEDNEPLYTEDGEVANQPAPAHRFGWTGGGYAWVGGLFNPQLIERSKLAVPNEPVQFTRDNTHRCLLPEAATAGAWLDNLSVVFSRTGIYVVPPSLGAPQRLPSTVGCIDWRSVVEMPDGIGFQSRRGYELLPRGLGEPRVISDPVQDELRGRRVISATVTGHSGSDFADSATAPRRELVLFAIDPTLQTDPGVRLVLNLDSGRWESSDPAMAASAAIGEVLTTWDGRLVAASRTGTNIRIEDPTDWGTEEAVPVSVTLADFRPFGLVNRGQVARVIVLGEYRSETNITITASQDGKYSKPLLFDKPTQLVTGTKGDKFLLEWGLPVRQVGALTLKIDCADPGATPGEGVVLHAIGVEAEGLPGRPRTTQERTAT